jgi:hypothetical protein
MLLGRAVGVTKLELFEPEHVRARRGDPKGGRPAEGSEPDDLDIAIALHRAALVVSLVRVPQAVVSLGRTLSRPS